MNSIDNRVVQMEFNNKRFEQNAKETMATLDKLKEKLNFKDSSKELQEFQSAADSFNLNHIANALDEIGNKFSFLGIIGQETMHKIASAAIDTSAKILKSISVDQISAGMGKYEQETNAVQALYAALKPKGKSLEDIYAVLNKLTEYSDETSYSYAQMADGVSKFVASGQDIEKSEVVMEGIANAAALAGVSIQNAQIAFRNFSDAMGKGKFQLQDWKSIQNIHMDTEAFKNEVIQTAIELGKLDKQGQITVGSGKNARKEKVTAANFSEYLRYGFFDSDVIMATMEKYADRTSELGEAAFKAAQQAKTFTDVMDAVKDAVSTGWKQTFKLIFGDLNEAIDLFTPMANMIIEVTTTVSDLRNEALEKWKNFGGRDSVISAAKSLFEVLFHSPYLNQKSIFEMVFDNLTKAVFPEFLEEMNKLDPKDWDMFNNADILGYKLLNFSKKIEEATKSFNDFILAKNRYWTILSIVKNLLSVLGSARGIIGAVISFFKGVIKQLSPLIDPILLLFRVLSEDFSKLASMVAKYAKTLSPKIAAILEPITSRLPAAVKWIWVAYTRLKTFLTQDSQIVKFGQSIKYAFESWLGSIPKAIEAVLSFGEKMIEMVKNSKEWKFIVDNFNKFIKPVIRGLIETATMFNAALGDFLNMDTSEQNTLWDKLKKRFSAFDKLPSYLLGKWEKIKTKLPWLQKAEDWFNSSPLIAEIKSWISEILKAVDKFFSVDTSGESSLIGKIKSRFEAMFEQLAPWITEKITEYKEKYPIFKTIAEWLEERFGSIGDLVSKAGGIEGIFETAKNIFNKISSLITAFASEVKNTFNKLGGLSGVFAKVKEKIKLLVAFLEELFSSKSGAIQQASVTMTALSSTKAFAALSENQNNGAIFNVSEWFNNLLKKFGLEEFAKNFNVNEFLKTVTRILLILRVMRKLRQIGKNIETWTSIGESIKGIFTSISNVADAGKTYIETATKKLKRGKWKDLAIVFLALAGAVYIIIKAVDEITKLGINEKTEVAFGGVIVIMAMLAIVARSMKNVKLSIGSALSIIAAAFAVRMIVDTVLDTSKKIDKSKLLDYALSIGLVGLCVLAIAGLSKTIGNVNINLRSSVGIIASVLSVKMLANTILKTANKIDQSKLTDYVVSIGLVGLCVLGIAALTKIMDGAVINVSTIVGVIVAVLAVKLLAGTIFSVAKKIQKFNLLEVLSAFGLVALCVVGIESFIWTMSNANISTKALIGIGLAIAGVVVIIVAIGAVLNSMHNNGVDPSSMLMLGGTLLAIAAAMAIMAAVIKMFGTIGPGTAAKGALTMAIAAAGLGAAIAIIVLITSQSIENFSNTVALVGANLAQYSDQVSDIDMTAVENSITMIKDLSEIFVEVGGKSYGELETFKTNLTRMGGGLRLFYISTSRISKEYVSSIITLITDISTAFETVGGKTYTNLAAFRSNLTEMGGSLELFNDSAGKINIELSKSAIGFVTEASAVFVEVGGKDYGSLETFKTNLTGMGGTLELFNDSANKVGDFSKANDAATFLSTVSGIFSEVGGKEYDNCETFRTALSRTGYSIKNFETNTQNADLERLKSITDALKTMATDLSGFPEVSDVGTSIANIGGAIKLYAKSLEDTELDKAPDSTAIKTVFDTLKDALPKDENLAEVAEYASDGKGDQMTNFAIGLTNIATAVSDFSKSTENMDFTNINKAVSALQAINTLNAQMTTTTVTEYDGFSQAVTTQVSPGNLNTFATDVTALGDAVAKFGESVKDTNFDTVDKAVDALKAINSLNTQMTSTSVSEYGSFSQETTAQVEGDNRSSLENFAANIVVLGNAVANFGDSVKDANFTNVNKAVDALNAINTLNTSLMTTTISYYGSFATETKNQVEGNPISSFAENIVVLGNAVADFGDKIANTNFDNVDRAIDSLGSISKLNNELNTSIIVKFGPFAVELNKQSGKLSTFAEDIIVLGGALKDFGDNLSTVDTGKIDKGIESLNKIVDINKALPKTGGVSQWLSGKQDLGNFAGQLRLLGSGTSAFWDEIKGSEIDENKIKSAAGALLEIVKVNNQLPTTGGLNQLLVGEQELGKFGTNLKSLGAGAAEFNESIKGESFDAGKIETAADALIKIVDLNKALPETGGLLSWFTGDQSLEGFSSGLGALGTGVKDFVINLGDQELDDKLDRSVQFLNRMAGIQIRLSGKEHWYSMSQYAAELQTAAGSMAELNRTLIGAGTWADSTQFEHLLNFAADQHITMSGQTGWEAMSTCAKYLDEAADYIASANDKIGKVTSWADTTEFEHLLTFAVTQQKRLGDKEYTRSLRDIGVNIRDFFNEVWGFTATWTGADSGKLEKVASAVTSVFTSIGGVFAQAGGEGNTFTTGGQNIIASIASGMTNSASETKVKGSTNTVISWITTTITSSKTSFYNSGTWIPAGLADGIWGNKQIAIDSAALMMRLVIEAANKEAGIASPSKEFYAMGYWSVRGYEKGIHKYIPTAIDASETMVDKCVSTVYKKVEEVKDAVSAVAKDAVDNIYETMYDEWIAYMDTPFDETEWNPLIRPVIDDQSAKEAADAVSSIMEGQDKTVSANATAIESRLQKLYDIKAAGKEAQMLYDVDKRIAKLTEQLAGIKIVLDSGILVGELSPKIDESLGKRAELSDRGN